MTICSGIARRLVALTLASTLATQALAHSHDVMDLDTLMRAFGWDMDNAEIRTEKVADGFYLLFGVGGNIGVSVGEQGVLIVDDQFPQLMPKIEAAIEKVGGKGVDFAINTHWHFDHAEGNLALGPKGTWIVAQANSRTMMQDEHLINLVVAKYRQQAYPADALPVITYNDRMQFHFNGQEVELLHFGPAHTTGDTAVYFKGTNAVHLGDVFNRGYPFIDADNGGEIDGMIAFCEGVLGEINKETKVIPGHGEISDYQGLADYITMLKTVRTRILSHLKEGKSLAAVAAAKPTEEFDATFGDPTGFVNRAYTSLLKRIAAEADADR